MKIVKLSQDFDGYFQGEVPDYAVNLLNSATVDAGQISSMFGKANDAIQLVNQFDSSLLSNVSFIFNFSKSGAYGVYLSELDRAIKTKALTKQLESLGYTVEPDEQSMLKAYSDDEEKSQEEIQKDIDKLYADLNQKGGTAFGINMNSVLNAARQDSVSIEDPNAWEWSALLHLGATIVHEATHAKGFHEEATPEAAESKFMEWALPKINEKYQQAFEASGMEGEFRPLIITDEKRYAGSKGWYKTAQQLGYYMPKSFFTQPHGSDLDGRFADEALNREGTAAWGMMAQEHMNAPIEKRLGRQYMSPLPEGLDQNNQSYEEQLRNYTKGEEPLDPKASMNELLSEGYEEDLAYETLEQLLENQRPKPLIVPIPKETEASSNDKVNKVAGSRDTGHLYGKDLDELTIEKLRQMAVMEMPEGKYRIYWDGKNFMQEDIKRFLWYWDNREELREQMALEFIPMSAGGDTSVTVASKIQKVATLFGWMNNLEISDGSTIPGLSDRVMSWESAEEDFVAEEDWVRQQRRYNPSYDIKGFYYRWIEPRFKPQLWDRMVQGPDVHPARRFAQKKDTDYKLAEANEETMTILGVLVAIRKKIAAKEIKATRLVMTSDVLEVLGEEFSGDFIIKAYELGEQNGEMFYSVWVVEKQVDLGDVDKAEAEIQKGNFESDLVEELLGLKAYKKNAIKKIIEEVENACKDYGVKDVYLVGGFPRDIIISGNMEDVQDLDFSGAWPNQCLKIGGIVAERLGVRDTNIYHRTMTLSFEYRGVKIDFRGNFVPQDIRKRMRDYGLKTTPLNMDLYNRDFTINMLMYDVAKKKIHDISKEAVKDIRAGVIITFFEPSFVCKENPLIILRALKFAIRYGFKIDSDLARAMMANVDTLFSGRISPERVMSGIEDVEKEGFEEAQKLFKEFGLDEKLGS